MEANALRPRKARRERAEVREGEGRSRLREKADRGRGLSFGAVGSEPRCCGKLSLGGDRLPEALERRAVEELPPDTISGALCKRRQLTRRTLISGNCQRPQASRTAARHAAAVGAKRPVEIAAAGRLPEAWMIQANSEVGTQANQAAGVASAGQGETMASAPALTSTSGSNGTARTWARGETSETS